MSSLLSGRMGRSDEALSFLNAIHGARLRCSLALKRLSVTFSYAVDAWRRRRPLFAVHWSSDPTSVFGHYNLGSVLLARSQPDAALAEYLKETVDVARLGGSAMAYFALGRETDSNGALAQMIKDQAQHPFLIAEV